MLRAVVNVGREKKNVAAVGECRYSYRFISVSVSIFHAIYERANFWAWFLVEKAFRNVSCRGELEKNGQSRLGVLFSSSIYLLEPCVILYSRRASEICFIGTNPLFHILNIGVI
jgi:hypothetical protein